MDKTISVDALRAQADVIRKRMAADSAQLDLIESLIALSQRYLESREGTPAAEVVNVVAQKFKRRGWTTTKRERLIAAAEGILADGVRRYSRELVNELQAHGVEVGGKDPALNLSSYLSHEKEIFNSDQKRGGWTLVRLLKGARPDETGTLPGLFSNGSEVTLYGKRLTYRRPSET